MMGEKPASAIALDGGESAGILGGYDKVIQHPIISILSDDSSSSSTLSAETIHPLESSSSNASNEHLNLSQGDTPQSKFPLGRIFIARDIFEPLPAKLPDCSTSIPIEKPKNVPSRVTYCAEVNAGKLIPGKTQIFQQSPITSYPNMNIAQSVAVRGNLPVQNKQYLVARKRVEINKNNTKSLTKQNQERLQSQQNNTRKNLVQTRIIKNKKVYLPDISKEKIEEPKIGNEWNIKNKAVSEEQDPLYIPTVPEKTNVSAIIKPATSLRQVRKKKLDDFSVFSPNNRLNESLPCPIEKPPIRKDEKTHSMNMTTPSISSRQPNEHSVVKNYALQNNVSKRKRKEKKINTTSYVPIRPKPTSTVINSDLIYKNKQLYYMIPTNSDYCRNLFIKTSAWDYLEPAFKGFNERETNISKSCLEYFSQLSNSLSSPERKQNESLITDNDLYYTNKIEVLDQEGKLDKVVYISPDDASSRKRKSNSSSYVQPPTKNCNIVLERNEVVEQKVENYLIQKKLDSYLLHYLRPSKEDAKKPLIILNNINFNVLKINETLCKHANIVYVKNAGDEFPEKLYKNSFFVDQIENKIIKLLSEEALKTYFM